MLLLLLLAAAAVAVAVVFVSSPRSVGQGASVQDWARPVVRPLSQGAVG